MIGTTINDRYQIESELGQGGMGTVYQAHDTTLDRDVAVKVLSKAGLGTEGRARLLSEARIIAKLNHPNIVTVFDAGEADLERLVPEGALRDNLPGLVPFIVMEYVEGVNLYEQPPESFEESVAIAQQLCAALEHAHANGIIHRDLKPENIIITPDGTAMLMDFGMARSVASRLTSEGTIVGTVFYLAPEQALRQGIDHRADLYSLGVMLYELTTGGLPFQADDPVAIISQHLHAPLVPPRAKNPEIPPGLESLIIQLMSKDPADRPASAAEVRQLLAKPNLLDREAPSAIEHTLLDRIVRGQIVGRKEELQRARDFWSQAQSSEGQTLLISGEPGIGKTRLMREVVTQAEVSGGQALVGACFPEGNGPYEAFRQIIRRAFRRNSDLQDDFPEFVLAELLTLAPNLRITYPDVPDNPSLEPQAQQQRLLESVVTFCRALSNRAPLLLVVEDLHWADGGTLALFRHLTRRIRRQRLMILGTYREVELDQNLPFTQVLSDLHRERLATRLKLGRLSREQTREMLVTLFSEETTPEFLDGIYYETEGNPFFIEEVCKALLENGKLQFDGQQWQRLGIKELEIPQSVRVAIQGRVSKLPDEVRDTLTLAAILGREFDFNTLTEASRLDEDTLIEALESAERAQLIEEVSSEWGGTFTFSHALIPTTLAGSLSGLKRRRLHRRVAAVLENLRPDDFDTLAYQYTQAEVEDKALTYLTKAADRASQKYANEDAIRYYTQALEILPEEDSRSRFDLLAARTAVYGYMARREAQQTDAQAMLDLAETLNEDVLRCRAYLALSEYYRAWEYRKAFELASLALEIARSLKDSILEAWALLQAGDMNWRLGNYQSSVKMLEPAAELFQQEGLEAEAARCLHTLSVAHYNSADYPAGMKAAEEAVKLSRTAGNKRQEAIALRRLGIAYGEQENYDEGISYTEKALEMNRQIGDRDAEMDALNNLGVFYSNSGTFEEAKRYYSASIQIAEETGSRTSAVANYYYSYVVPVGEYETGLSFMQEGFDRALKDGNAALSETYLDQIRNLLFDLGQYERVTELAQKYVIESIYGQAAKLVDWTNDGLCQYLLGEYEMGLQMMRTASEQLKSLQSFEYYAFALLQTAFALSFGEDQSDWLAGLEDANQALPLFREVNNEFGQAITLSTIARLHLKLGQVEEAIIASIKAVEVSEAKRVFRFQEVYFLTHAQVLQTTGRDEEADRYLQKAYGHVKMVASKIKDEDLRRGYLENVPINREILKLAEEKGIATVSWQSRS